MIGIKKYTLSEKQEKVVNLSEKVVSFSRGRGATFSIVLGAIYYALKNKKSKILLCSKSLADQGFSNNLQVIMKNNWWLSHWSIKEVTKHNNGRIFEVVFRNKSVIRFYSMDSLPGFCGPYDLMYTDTRTNDTVEFIKVPYIANKYCMVVLED